MDKTIRSMPPISRLRPFEAAARLESFSAAADELGLSQTAISKQIALLEAELGTPLFERRNRAVFLTAAGRRLGHVVSAALKDIATEMSMLRGVRRSSELVLHCQLCEAFYWLMPRLSRFHERYPDVELRIVSALTPLTGATEDFDVALQTSSRPSGTARLAFTADDDVFPVCSPSLIAENHRTIDLRDLMSFPLLSHHVVPQDWIEWKDWFAAVGLSSPAPVEIVEFNSYPLALQAAVAGRGIALGWRRTTEALIEEGKLVRPCKESVFRPAELSVYRRPSSAPHANVNLLIDWLREELVE